MTKLPLALLLALLTLTLPAGSQSDDAGQRDHELARDAVGRGDFLPLDDILDIVAQGHPGQLVEVELEIDDGRWVYEVEIVTPDGRLIEIDLEAATGAIIEVEEADD